MSKKQKLPKIEIVTKRVELKEKLRNLQTELHSSKMKVIEATQQIKVNAVKNREGFKQQRVELDNYVKKEKQFVKQQIAAEKVNAKVKLSEEKMKAKTRKQELRYKVKQVQAGKFGMDEPLSEEKLTISDELQAIKSRTDVAKHETALAESDTYFKNAILKEANLGEEVNFENEIVAEEKKQGIEKEELQLENPKDQAEEKDLAEVSKEPIDKKEQTDKEESTDENELIDDKDESTKEKELSIDNIDDKNEDSIEPEEMSKDELEGNKESGINKESIPIEMVEGDILYPANKSQLKQYNSIDKLSKKIDVNNLKLSSDIVEGTILFEESLSKGSMININNLIKYVAFATDEKFTQYEIQALLASVVLAITKGKTFQFGKGYYSLNKFKGVRYIERTDELIVPESSVVSLEKTEFIKELQKEFDKKVLKGAVMQITSNLAVANVEGQITVLNGLAFMK